MRTDISKFVKPWIKEVKDYTPGEWKKGYIKLASNENNYGPTLKVVRAVEETKNLVHIYPHRDYDVRCKIAGYLDLKPENIIVGNGSDEIMDFILKTFKGSVMSFYPTYLEYEIFVKALGEQYLSVNLNKDFSFPIDKFISKSKDANIIFLGNPNNPTGTVIPEEDIKRILNEGKITVVDEAYYEFYGKTIIPWIKEYNNLIVLRTFAKAFGMAGLRVGYAVSDSEIIELLNKVKPPFNVNSIAQEAVFGAIDDYRAMEMIVEKIKRDREILYKELSRKYKVVKSCANFLLVDVSPIKADDFFNEMLKYGIIIRKFGKFEGFPGEYVRITVGTWGENQKLIKAL